MDVFTQKLHYETITPLLQQILETLMSAELFDSFRLVGGTNLSLRDGHRMSIDIDLFADAGFTLPSSILAVNFFLANSSELLL